MILKGLPVKFATGPICDEIIENNVLIVVVDASNDSLQSDGLIHPIYEILGSPPSSKERYFGKSLGEVIWGYCEFVGHNEGGHLEIIIDRHEAARRIKSLEMKLKRLDAGQRLERMTAMAALCIIQALEHLLPERVDYDMPTAVKSPMTAGDRKRPSIAARSNSKTRNFNPKPKRPKVKGGAT